MPAARTQCYVLDMDAAARQYVAGRMARDLALFARMAGFPLDSVYGRNAARIPIALSRRAEDLRRFAPGFLLEFASSAEARIREGPGDPCRRLPGELGGLARSYVRSVEDAPLDDGRFHMRFASWREPSQGLGRHVASSGECADFFARVEALCADRLCAMACAGAGMEGKDGNS